MRWRGRERSDNAFDERRRRRAPAAAGVGGGLVALIVVILYIALGGDPQQAVQLLDNQGGGPRQNAPARNTAPTAAEDELLDFVSVVLKDTENVWHKLFQESNMVYREPKMRVFTDHVESGCGSADASIGPFYCPADETIYIDLSFYRDLKRKYGAPGDFAQAYVIAHEVGHHVQKLLGKTRFVHSQKGKVSEKRYNELSVRLELQADFYAGVWARHTHEMHGTIENGDIDEALEAARAIGDDRLQMRSRGTVNPDSFTHGSSAQRARWFLRGLETGNPAAGDTFSASQL